MKNRKKNAAEEKHWNSLKRAFKPLLNATIEEISLRIDQKFGFENEFKDEYLKARESARKQVCRFFDTSKVHVFRNASWRTKLSMCKTHYEKSELFFRDGSLSDALDALLLISTKMNLFLKELNSSTTPLFQGTVLSLIIHLILLEFVNEATFSDEATDALKEFIQIGAKIREDESFKTSKMKILEDVLRDRSEIRKYSNTKIDLDYNTCFVALAAPSMEGKTQSAFVLSEVKPLYFSMSEVITGDEKSDVLVDTVRKQPIYENYASLAKTLCKCAIDDLDRVNGGKLLQAGNLKNDYRSTQFLTLGFLMKLVEQSSHYPATQSWMEFHSRRPGFTFTSKSLSQVGNIFEGYTLMLDEFKAEAPMSFLRNLARAVGLTCVVANTNTRIANVVGRTSSSGSSKNSVWSFVLTRLDPAYISVLDKEFQIKSSIEIIIQGRTEVDPVFIFFNEYFYLQLEHLRPGVAAFVAKILRDLTTVNLSVNTWNFGKLFDYLGQELKRKLLVRKKSLNNKVALLGHIALLLPETYADESDQVIRKTDEKDPVNVEPKYDEKDPINVEDVDNDASSKPENSNLIVGKKAFKQRRFLEHHVFYLTNPVDKSLDWFVTFPAERIESEIGSIDSPSLRIVSKIDEDYLENWEFEYTEFNRNEIFTLIGCQFITFTQTVATILKKADSARQRRDDSLTNSPNPNAVSSDGNSFEVLSAICVVKASQYYRNENHQPIHTFKGIPGDDLIKNIIYEMGYTNDAVSRNIWVPSDLLEILQSIKIPFLYSINRNDETFDNFCSISQDFFVKTYVRTSNNDQIDGKFEVHSPQGPQIIACECKNHADSIGTPILERVIRNSINLHDAKFTFIFCAVCVVKSTQNSQFTRLCDTKRVNVYRIVRQENKVAKLVPFWKNFKIHQNPNRICIVFESHIINNVEIVKSKPK